MIGGALARAMTTLELGLLTVYQKTLSLDHSFWGRKLMFRVCRYHPSCSAYMRECIEVYGPWTGPWRGLKRLVRCNPLFDGGFDPVLPETTAPTGESEPSQEG